LMKFLDLGFMPGECTKCSGGIVLMIGLRRRLKMGN
jgi:hypothetical protein